MIGGITRSRLSERFATLIPLLIVSALVLSSCVGAPTPTAAPTAVPTAVTEQPATEVPSTTSEPAVGGQTIGYAGWTLTDRFQVAVTKSIEAEAKAAGLTLLAPTNANNDLAKQVTDIKMLADLGAKGIIVSPVDSEGIKSAVDYATSKGVLVIAIDSGSPLAYMNVNADNYLMSVEDCKYLGEALGGEGKVLMTTGPLQLVTLR